MLSQPLDLSVEIGPGTFGQEQAALTDHAIHLDQVEWLPPVRPPKNASSPRPCRSSPPRRRA